MSDMIFICNRGKNKGTIKIQLELRKDVVEAIKIKAKEFQGGKYSAKQIMENLLTNYVDGVNDGPG